LAQFPVGIIRWFVANVYDVYSLKIFRLLHAGRNRNAVCGQIGDFYAELFFPAINKPLRSISKGAAKPHPLLYRSGTHAHFRARRPNADIPVYSDHCIEFESSFVRSCSALIFM
jgi:hypothetical protein